MAAHDDYDDAVMVVAACRWHIFAARRPRVCVCVCVCGGGDSRRLPYRRIAGFFCGSRYWVALRAYGRIAGFFCGSRYWVALRIWLELPQLELGTSQVLSTNCWLVAAPVAPDK